MKAAEIRQKFFDFFESKEHKIVPSAPLVNKDDPTLMFINAGMNQFKDYFLGNKKSDVKRIADTQKCLRVSGKHNDLDEVGRDSYHQTMFEMLGNWSFGDYFKQAAIDWAWELLTEVYGLEKERIYITCFEGDKNDGLEQDSEAANIWTKHVPKERVLFFDRKDNFWEMGDTGPCGPCSEIHIDLRSDEDRKALPGADLVNMDHPQVIEIWNLVFIQYNRKADGSLESLPDKHVDTGMGFERLCMALQGKLSNYDTDLFSPIIELIEKKSGLKYEGIYDESAKKDIAMRVVSDHLRAVSFAIADGQLPSNNGAGYVIRRILRRAIRYYYSFLNIKEPFIYTLVDFLSEQFKDVFPELIEQKDFVAKVIQEEEKSFLRALEGGLKKINSMNPEDGIIDGATAFELYDTFGFPIDLTRLISEEKGWTIDEKGYEAALQEQKSRSRADAEKTMGDWIEVKASSDGVEFLGYDNLELEGASLLRHRTVVVKKKEQYQLVLDKTTFYPEGGGQVGDRGVMHFGNEEIRVFDTVKENDLIIHIVDKLPENPTESVSCKVDASRRRSTENNHSSTHLLHSALREVLGDHVQQKGSLVNKDYLRFDFSHFQKMTDEQIKQVERRVNDKIRENITLKEDRKIPIAQAKESGATMLFGEKYGDHVRMITFDPSYSVELCGGCHVSSTGVIGSLIITKETSVAAGVRRIEAVTADAAYDYVQEQFDELQSVKSLFKNPTHTVKNVQDLQSENQRLLKEIEKLQAAQASNSMADLKSDFVEINGVNFLGAKLDISDSKQAKTLAYNLEKDKGNAVVVLGIESEGKAQILIKISEELTKSTDLHAGNMIREIAKEINGGGGGQAFFASAGGKNPAGIENAIAKAKEMI